MMLCCDELFLTALIGAFRSLLFDSVICSRCGLLSHGSPVVVFFDRGPSSTPSCLAGSTASFGRTN